MLENLVSVGPPLTGVPTGPKEILKAPEDRKGESFSGVLEKKMTSEDRSSDSKAEKLTVPVKENTKRHEPEKQENRGDPPKTEKRAQAIEQFMDSFESELGIPATRLVAAIANLTPEELAAQPEVTAEKVVAGLGLSAEDTEKAQALYAGLLLNLQQIDQRSQVQGNSDKQVMSAAGGAGALIATQQSMASPQAPPSAVESAKGLTQSPSPRALSAMQGQHAPFETSSVVSNSILGESQAESLLAMDSAPSMPGAKVRELPNTLDALSAPRSLLPELKPLSADSVLEVPSDMPIDELTAKAWTPEPMPAGAKIPMSNPVAHRAVPVTELSPFLMAGLASGKVAAQDEANQMDSMSSLLGSEDGSFPADLKTQTKDLSQMTLPSQQALDLESFEQGFLQQGFDQSQGQMSFQEQSMMASMPKYGEVSEGEQFELKTSQLESSSSVPTESPLGMPKVNALESNMPYAQGAAVAKPVMPQDNEMNTQQLLNQTKYLMSKGGGEVNVKMTPEGMGSVHLKVLMIDGKMQIQMNADSKEAKSVLESSLADLKTSLAAQKLSVDNIKVDVVNATANDTAANNQMNNQQGQRENRQFWQSFQESFGQNAKRDSFFESPNGKGFKSKGFQPLQPIQVSSPSSSAHAMQGKGRGLNLVA